jgi:hypothetical protein
MAAGLQNVVDAIRVDIAAEDAAIAAIAVHPADKANPHAVTKSQVGLGNVDNTADTAKPVSTAQAAAIAAAVNGIAGLGGKLNISGGTMTGLLGAMAAPTTAAQVRNISIGTELLEPGVSPLAAGEIYICYE